jgi:hypothetical protein
LADLIERIWSVIIGDVLIEANELANFTIRFEVVKSTAREPNTANLQIANLAPETAQRLQALDDPQIELRAGYPDNTDVIFVGDARDIYTTKDATERWTYIESEDGGTAYRTAQIDVSFGNNTPIRTVIQACAEAMGVGLGNTAEIAASATLEDGEDNYATGTTLSGLAHRELSSICRACDLRYSVQNGILQLRAAGRPAEVRAIRLTPGTGLLGSPSRGKRESQSQRVTVEAKALLIPGLYPGRVVSLESQEISGNYMVKRVRYAGETTGPDWYADLSLEEYDA